TDLGDFSIRLRNSNRGISRLANLSGYTSATLTFEYRKDSMENGDAVTVQVTADGSVANPTWVNLNTYNGNGTDDAAYQSATFDITSYIGPNTGIRFLANNNMSNNDRFWIDNVQIQATGRFVTTSAGCAPATLVGAAGCNGFTLQPGEIMIVTY